jgi:hypothetical protein
MERGARNMLFTHQLSRTPLVSPRPDALYMLNPEYY